MMESTLEDVIPCTSLCDSVEQHLSQFFAAHEHTLPEGGLYDRIISEIERVLISKTLAIVGGNQLKAAKILGINRNTLRKKMSLLGL